MKIFKNIINLFGNLYNLIRIASKNDHVYWENLGSNILKCNIHKDTRIYKYHFLSNSSVGEGSYISLNARIYNTNIGKYCSIGPNLLSGWGMHPIHGLSTSPIFYSKSAQVGWTLSKENKVIELLPIYIGNDVFIGANVTILDGVTIGDGAVIGAGAVVSKDIPPYAVAVGCPIKIIKYRFDDKTIEKLLKIRWWDGDLETMKKVEKMFLDVEGFIKD